jgi:hypothetical protein
MVITLYNGLSQQSKMKTTFEFITTFLFQIIKNIHPRSYELKSLPDLSGTLTPRLRLDPKRLIKNYEIQI